MTGVTFLLFCYFFEKIVSEYLHAISQKISWISSFYRNFFLFFPNRNNHSCDGTLIRAHVNLFFFSKNLNSRLRGEYGELWPKNQCFLFLLNVPHTIPEWFRKHQETRIFFLLKIFFFFAFSPMPISRIICVSFYNIDWYIIYLMRLYF